MIHDQVGSLEVGKKADLVILDTKSINFTPLNDLRNHVVYCENGTSITTVICNGEIVVKDGKLMRVNEAALVDELRRTFPSFRSTTHKSRQSTANSNPISIRSIGAAASRMLASIAIAAARANGAGSQTRHDRASVKSRQGFYASQRTILASAHTWSRMPTISSFSVAGEPEISVRTRLRGGPGSPLIESRLRRKLKAHKPSAHS